MKKNAGFVLVTGMVFLMVITIIVIYLLRTSLLEEKMAANSIDRQRAVQAADAVLREAEAVIEAGGPPYDPFLIDSFSSTCASGLCRVVTGSLWTSINWSTVGKQSGMSFSSSKVETPRYVIEVMKIPVKNAAEGCSMAAYRIVAKGVGKTGAESVVQSHFQNRPKKCE